MIIKDLRVSQINLETGSYVRMPFDPTHSAFLRKMSPCMTNVVFSYCDSSCRGQMSNGLKFIFSMIMFLLLMFFVHTIHNEELGIETEQLTK